MIETRTAVFEAAPFYVVLTFHLVDNTGRMRVEYSVRSHTPQPVDAMLRVQALWQSWVGAIVAGEFPPLPIGWQHKDGAREVAPSRTPDHLH